MSCSCLDLSISVVSPLFAADTPFPRGGGLYFHPAKLVLLLVVYLAWLRTCWWVHSDCQAMKLSAETWNPVLLICGIAGLFFVWLLPWFWLGILVLIVLYLDPAAFSKLLKR